MTPVQIIGVVLLALGVALLFFGFNMAESPADQLTEALTGEYRERTMWYIIGGFVAIVAGGLMALFGR
jgi:uncharacterized membrane protein